MRKLKAIDLFAGIGGIRLGFENVFKNQIETVFMSEWDLNAQTTYETNFKDKISIAGDITKIDEKDIPEFDICLAGFPCQAFSIAGKKQGFEDNYKGLCRGTLFLDVVRICEYHKPAVIFCENVKGLIIHDKGRTFQIIRQTFERIGYRVFYEILNSKNFGVPQNRERIYIVAFRNDIVLDKFKFPKSTDKTKRIKDILEKNKVSAKYYLSETYINTLKRHKQRHQSKGHGFGYEIRDKEDISGAIVCGGMGRERNLIIDDRINCYVSPTCKKGKINKENIRMLTPREWARLQGFPDDFKMPLADTHMYRQFGNSVTVPVIEAIAKEIKKVLVKNYILKEDNMEQSKLSGNKGEWSEIYVFLRLLEIGKLYAADADLNKMEGVFYNIINIIRNESIGKLEFHVLKNQNIIKIIKSETREELGDFDINDIKRVADKLYEDIIHSNKSAFSLEDTESFLNKMSITTLKAKSNDKSDIKIKIHDINTGIEAVQGFSIKSRLGSASTLINAAKTTNFIYKITGPINDTIMHDFNNCSKLFKKRFELLNSHKCDINYETMENRTFEGNLLMIDGDLPRICSYMLKTFYQSGIKSVLKSIDFMSEVNPMNYNLSLGHPFYKYKFKKLLSESALGMVPSKAWNGLADATGGYIIVREDGEVLCYHLFNRNEFENYLLKNTKFETASTSRNNFGDIYKEDNEYYIKLNLQIRFVK